MMDNPNKPHAMTRDEMISRIKLLHPNSDRARELVCRLKIATNDELAMGRKEAIDGMA